MFYDKTFIRPDWSITTQSPRKEHRIWKYFKFLWYRERESTDQWSVTIKMTIFNALFPDCLLTCIQGSSHHLTFGCLIPKLAKSLHHIITSLYNHYNKAFWWCFCWYERTNLWCDGGKRCFQIQIVRACQPDVIMKGEVSLIRVAKTDLNSTEAYFATKN